MIVLDLCCDSHHVFEAWFASSESFETQLAEGKIACAICSSTSVVRRPSAPYVQRGAGSFSAREQQQVVKPPAAAMQAAMLKLLRDMASAAENVGTAFPEEARKIHYGEAEERGIRGVASREQTEALLDEGILVVPAPLPDDDALH